MYILYITWIHTPRVSSSELRTRLAEALRSAAAGDPVVITRRGKPAPLYRASGGRLSRKAPETARPEPAPPVPRYAGVTVLASEVPCARYGSVLEPGPVIWVFDHLAPICDACARDQVPELAGLLTVGRIG